MIIRVYMFLFNCPLNTLMSTNSKKKAFQNLKSSINLNNLLKSDG